MLFDAIFVTLFVLGWLICGLVPWLAYSVVTRGRAGLWNLPLSLFAAVVGGLAVPLLWRGDVTGIGLSFIVAVALASGLLFARRVGAPAIEARRERTKPPARSEHVE